MGFWRSTTVLKHFTSRDVISRWDVLEVHERATAKTAATFLTTLQARMPFPIRAIQSDGGSEFQVDFELACQQRGIRLFALPPRSPKLNGAVERAQRTHTEEFYEVCELPWKTMTTASGDGELQAQGKVVENQGLSGKSEGRNAPEHHFER